MSDHTNDLVSKIVEANALENAGETEAAIALYQEILELDHGGNYGDVAQQALANLQELSSSNFRQSQVSLANSPKKSWQNLSLRLKVPLLIIALSILPTIVVGATAYSLVNQLTTETTSEKENLAASQNLAWTLASYTTAITIVTTGIGYLAANRLVRPIMQVGDAVEKLGKGELKTRVSISGEDELANLGRNINKMAGQIEDLLYTQETETKQQRQEKELLQQGVMSLLLDVEGAQRGDLTVRAQMTDGAVGSIADAFNATMGKLRGLLQEVQTVSAEVGQLSLAGEDSVRQLSESAISQTAEINQALSSIDEINQSVETVANYAQQAAKIARNGSIQAREGDLAMDATVNSIEKIRDTVANTSKKVKQLAESSQEIAQIVEIISGISEKTNLLAFNASVEAARAGEHGEGFRIVAEEVRRLADRITEATKDIQELVDTIQQDTTSVLQGMETSTTEVVNGSELVRMTKLNLRSLADTSKQIDEYLKYISTSTIDQTNTSQQVNQKISGIATLARTNSTEAQNVVQSLRILVSEAKNLQSSISQFKLEA
ncbi:MAG: methyl-accepting chemotaxis protein [Pleurocapsa sp.]